MPNDVNSFFGRAISVEVAVSLAAMLLCFWGGYSVLADDQEEQSNEISEIKRHQQQIRDSTHAIETDVAIIRNNQKHLRDALNSNKADIKVIRGLLERKSVN